ncbi:MAG TPA: DUF983 domain-containing protein [Thermomicrobiales bacterium]|nr:DUF983 domain-containing protein [Thermomicrobiales bacterium]
MERPKLQPHLINLPDAPLARLLVGIGRAFRRHCPYCGGGHIFDGWFTLKKQCPTCGVTYAYETGYFLGSYVVNIVVTEFVAVAAVVALLIWSDLSVLQLQIAGVVLAVGLPILFYPFALLLWVALDVTFHPPNPATGKRDL